MVVRLAPLEWCCSQRRTAEEIVDFLARVFPKRISTSICTLSWFIDAAKTSSKDQNLQRTVEQIVNDYVSKAVSQVLETTLGARERSHVIEEPKISRQDVEVVKTTIRAKMVTDTDLLFFE